MNKSDDKNFHGDAWARFRFAVVGPLFCLPPHKGELTAALEALAGKVYQHPITGQPIQFSFSTIERWYYLFKHNKAQPLVALANHRRKDSGIQRVLTAPVCNALGHQYHKHPSWSVKLHHQNLVALSKQQPELKDEQIPSYGSIRRFMRSEGLFKQPRSRGRDTAGMRQAYYRRIRYEIRSFESVYVNHLWHSDFHVGSLPVLLADGSQENAHLFGALDDRSRLACHLQWYLSESGETTADGFCQAMEKHGLPAGLMHDGGAGYIADETRQALADLGINDEPTLVYSPYQNGKQEAFWGQIEGRLLPMLESCQPLTIQLLNRATCAWQELEYNRSIHSELGCTPLERFLAERNVSRPCPPSEILRRSFTQFTTRRQRKGDGTISLENVRFEIPSQYRHLSVIPLRYARWNLRCIYLADPKTRQPVCPLFPVDKQKNADGRRRLRQPTKDLKAPPTEPLFERSQIAPLLAQLMDQYERAGLPPAYLPKDDFK